MGCRQGDAAAAGHHACCGAPLAAAVHALGTARRGCACGAAAGRAGAAAGGVQLPRRCQQRTLRACLGLAARAGQSDKAGLPRACPMRPSGASLALKPSRFSSEREAGFSGVQICGQGRQQVARAAWTGSRRQANLPLKGWAEARMCTARWPPCRRQRCCHAWHACGPGAQQAGRQAGSCAPGRRPRHSRGCPAGGAGGWEGCHCTPSLLPPSPATGSAAGTQPACARLPSMPRSPPLSSLPRPQCLTRGASCWARERVKATMAPLVELRAQLAAGGRSAHRALHLHLPRLH